MAYVPTENGSYNSQLNKKKTKGIQMDRFTLMQRAPEPDVSGIFLTFEQLY